MTELHLHLVEDPRLGEPQPAAQPKYSPKAIQACVSNPKMPRVTLAVAFPSERQLTEDYTKQALGKPHTHMQCVMNRIHIEDIKRQVLNRYSSGNL